MESVFFTYTANEITVDGAAVPRAAGEVRRMTSLRPVSAPPPLPAGPGKVVDFTAWRQSHEPQTLDFDGLEEDWEELSGENSPWARESYDEEPLPRRARAGRSGRKGTANRRGQSRRGRALPGGWTMLLDWAATLAVIAAAAAVCIRFLG